MNPIINWIIKRCLLCKPQKRNPEILLIGILILLNNALKNSIFCQSFKRVLSVRKQIFNYAANLQQKIYVFQFNIHVWSERFSIISPHIISPHIISPHIHFTPRSFHPMFISPQIHFTPHSNYQMRLR